jgi:hypothetical protein
MQQAEKTLSIREEYGAVLQMLEEPSKDTGGVVVTGQHGIGEWSLLFVIIFMTSPPKHCQLREMLRRLSNGKFTAFRYSKSSLSQHLSRCTMTAFIALMFSQRLRDSLCTHGSK